MTSTEGQHLNLHHVDVFTDRSMSGNGVTVVTCPRPLAAQTMLRITQELRQFETIFLFDVARGAANARIFTPEEELEFAGHPVLGAAAVLHAQQLRGSCSQEWTIRVAGRPVLVRTISRGRAIIAADMDQGPPRLSPPLAHGATLRFGAALGLRLDHLRYTYCQCPIVG